MNHIDRREFLALVTALVGGTFLPGDAEAVVVRNDLLSGRERNVRRIRDAAQARALTQGFPSHRNNSEEQDYPYFGNYSKYLPHDQFNKVATEVYRQLLKACKSGKFADYEAISLTGAGKLKNPMASVAYELEGLDSFQVRMPPSPRIDSAENSSEAAELYWSALTRDVNFADYETDPTVAQAASDLSNFSNFKGLKSNNFVTPQTFLRPSLPGSAVGPHISQLLLRDIPAGTLLTSHRQETLVPGVDFLTDYTLWHAAQQGKVRQAHMLDTERRYIRNGRDLAHYVHIDRLVQPFYNAALIIQFRLKPNFDFQFGANAPFDPGHPYLRSGNQQGFATFDYPHLLALVSQVVIPALKAAWFQKWCIHRRTRPEEFGGLVHNKIALGQSNPVHSEILNSAALTETFSRHGSYLLPQVFFEGCPAHPAYPSGHAVVSGACATILKAWFDESYVIENPVVSDVTGTSLLPYAGTDAGSMTLGGEINKLAWNISFGRCIAGVHWRSDAVEGLKLGERIAIGILNAHKNNYRERFSFTITKFDGSKVVIHN